MQIIILIDSEFDDYDLFKSEVLECLKTFNIPVDSNIMIHANALIDSKYAYKIDLIDNLVKEFNWEIYRHILYEVGWNNVANNIEHMSKVVDHNANSLIIDICSQCSCTDYKDDAIIKYFPNATVYKIIFKIKLAELICCYEKLKLVNKDNIFSYFKCDTCFNKYILLNELLDEFIETTECIEITERTFW